jgi:hypothetical protein
VRAVAQDGAKLVVAEPRSSVAAAIACRHGATVVGLDSILDAKCEIFAPCALGAVIDERSVARLRARIVCGAANNVLATPEDGDRLADRGVLYAPDYVVNAGGIINVAAEYLGWSSRGSGAARAANRPPPRRGVRPRRAAGARAAPGGGLAGAPAHRRGRERCRGPRRMTGAVRYRVRAHARSGLLCRIIGLFAQLDLPAPALSVTVSGSVMEIDASLAHFGDALVPVVARKIAGLVGVEAVVLEPGQLELA